MSKTRVRNRVQIVGSEGIYEVRRGQSTISRVEFAFPFTENGCIDTVGDPGGQFNSFFVNGVSCHCIPANGQSIRQVSGIGELITRWTNVPVVPRTGTGSVQITHLPTVTNPFDANNVLKRTNPSRPEIDGAVFTAELKDLPGMLRSLRSLPRAIRTIASTAPVKTLDRIAKEYLGYQFGWAPMLSDVKKATDAHTLIDRRVKELVRLHGNGGLRRKVRVDSQIVDKTTMEQPWYPMTTGHARAYQLTKRDRWATTRWLPEPPSPLWVPSTSNPSLSDQARRAVLGLTVDAATAWELLPWSWLADWFSNVGDILAARRNIVGATAGLVYLMDQSVSTKTWKAETMPDGYIGSRPSYVVNMWSKTRSVHHASVLPQIDIPLLTGRQLSILSAIGWTRR